MNANEYEMITRGILGCAIKVSNTLGVGFLEKVYENALVIELRRGGFVAEQQVPLQVRYSDVVVGEYFVDILVNEVVLLELKVAKSFDENHQAQMINYLKATGLNVGLLLNFGTPRLGIKRMVLNLDES